MPWPVTTRDGLRVPADGWFDHPEAADYDGALIAHAVSLCRPGGLAVDIGAHVGLWTCRLLTCGQFAEVLSLEPNPDAFALLVANIKATQATERGRLTRAHVHQMAAGDEQGIVYLQQLAYNSGTVRVVPDRTKTPARCCLLDDLLQSGEDVTLIKVDVEGMEAEALRGACGTLERCRPVVVVEEGHGGTEAADFLRFLGMVEVRRYPVVLSVDNLLMDWSRR